MKGPGGANKVTKHEKTVELLPSLQILRKELDQEIKSGRIEVSMQARGLTISFQQAAFFPSGADDIAPDTYSSIEKVAAASNQTDVGRARNRRVDIVLLNQTGVMGEPERYKPN